MKVIIAKIVLYWYLLLLMAVFLANPLILQALLVFAGIGVVFLVLTWAIDTIVVDRNQKRKREVT